MDHLQIGTSTGKNSVYHILGVLDGSTDQLCLIFGNIAGYQIEFRCYGSPPPIPMRVGIEKQEYHA
jgi:hypothetical protein